MSGKSEVGFLKIVFYIFSKKEKWREVEPGHTWLMQHLKLHVILMMRVDSFSLLDRDP